MGPGTAGQAALAMPRRQGSFATQEARVAEDQLGLHGDQHKDATLARGQPHPWEAS